MNILILEGELQYVTEAFKKLKYPGGMLCKLKEKAKEIYRRMNNNRQEINKINFVTVPISNKTQQIDRLLMKAGIKMAK